MILHAGGDEIVGRLLRGVRGHGEHADDDVLVADDVGEPRRTR